MTLTELIEHLTDPEFREVAGADAEVQILCDGIDYPISPHNGIAVDLNGDAPNVVWFRAGA